ncbi:MAG: HAD family hydrolase [Chloroflexi bacterium]|nr:HAD family hydrolase [Chloroflexota bacterium]MCY3916657.1 HAD family hydrolase [Chloroflexota bacterium]
MAAQLKGALFDFDDTLVDWSGVQLGWREIEAARLSRVQEHVFHKTRAYWLTADRLLETYLQRTRAAWSEARLTLRAPHMPSILMETLDALGVATDRLDVDDVIRAYDWNVVPGTVVFPDVPPMLRALQLAGVKLGIVTNASQPMAMRDAELERHGLIQFFPDCRLSAADAGYLKPDKRIFNCALERMGTSPAETVFIGDNPEADIAGALSVGMKAVLRVTMRAEANGAYTAYQPRLRSMEGLPAILDEWYPGWRNGNA